MCNSSIRIERSVQWTEFDVCQTEAKCWAYYICTRHVYRSFNECWIFADFNIFDMQNEKFTRNAAEYRTRT